MQTMEELKGSLALANIMSVIWLGDWERYENIFAEMPIELREQFPFHQYYTHDEVAIWHENHFFIPGEYFISPYFSSYTSNRGQDVEERRKSLLCLIGHYEKMGFYFPLEKQLYPDHTGCIMVFLSSLLQEQIKAKHDADEELYFQLDELKSEILTDFIEPILSQLQKNSLNNAKHPFINEFLQYFFVH
ncbi:molecular chaperone TorD family protein [Bacillus sp. Bva_UNVM-123]|uniref:molecular chaperone TorD family protein n=1 Tax=Bacillus sp. Bva_UNVM-123 TaxID=2829798 RepID=UPI00391EF85A